ncbi:MAG: amino acid racemase [Verrucomicrobia bacterium]|nr:amino acid racemase [Verrucomicrobiota bacterium]MDA1065323.1 amino acid racemase [Verrucomicrobiota bacterium]
MKETLGILGGMGPLASAEFVKTLYEFNLVDKEQSAPACILYSDPSIPDRTEAILRGDTKKVIQRIQTGLENLNKLGATHFVIACISSHYFIPNFPKEFKDSIISLVDIALREVDGFPGKCLLLATNGTIRAKTFQKHPLWENLKGKLLIPEEKDQVSIHEFIYKQIKPNRTMVSESFLLSLMEKYDVDAFVAGCTEFHLTNKKLLASGNPSLRFIDPLYSIGREFPSLVRQQGVKQR